MCVLHDLWIFILSSTLFFSIAEWIITKPSYKENPKITYPQIGPTAGPIAIGLDDIGISVDEYDVECTNSGISDETTYNTIPNTKFKHVKGEPCETKRRKAKHNSAEPRSSKSASPSKSHVLNGSTNIFTNNSYYNSNSLHQNRLKNLSIACDKPRDYKQTWSYRHYNMASYFSKKYDFAYCKVPKVGSTFWTVVFAVLEHGIEEGKQLLQASRRSVHFRKYAFNKKFANLRNTDKRTVVVSRDPYTRLFSAYVDKIFLPLNLATPGQPSSHMRNSHRVSTVNCSSRDMTFQQFLDRIVQSSLRGGKLNPHWAPISSLCQPCTLNRLVHVKQETFSSDIQFTLKSVGVDANSYNFLVTAMQARRVEYTIPSIVTTVFSAFGKSQQGQHCMSRLELSTRIWTSFKIQGYLHKSLVLPTEPFTIKRIQVDADFFSDIILKAISQRPLTSAESKEQRHSYLCEAYKSVSPKTLTEVKRVFKRDFRMYGYSETLPC